MTNKLFLDRSIGAILGLSASTRKAHTERSGSDVEMKQFEATASGKQVVDHLPVGWTVALYNSHHKMLGPR